MALAAADQVGAAHASQRLAQQRPVVGVVPAQEGLVQPPLPEVLRDIDLLAAAGDLAQRVLARVPHRSGGRHRRRQEGLHLVRTEAVLLEPQRQLEHVIIGGARMGRDEVRDQVLLLARLLRELVEQLLEPVVGTHAGLHHLRQRPFANGLRRDLQVAANVVLREFLDVLRRLDGEVIAHPRGDQHFLDARQLARATIQPDQRRVVGVQVRADAGEDTGRPAAGRLDLRVFAVQPVHVGGRAA